MNIQIFLYARKHRIPNMIKTKIRNWDTSWARLQLAGAPS